MPRQIFNSGAILRSIFGQTTPSIPGPKQRVIFSAGGPSGTNANTLSFSTTGTLSNGEVIGLATFAAAISFDPASFFGGSQAAPAADAPIQVWAKWQGQAAVQIGTVTYHAGFTQPVCAFTITALGPFSYVWAVCPSPADSALSGAIWSMRSV